MPPAAQTSQLSATAKVALGMLAMRPRTGYEIKRFVDDSTRFFWAASYGQIYPELKKLSERGLATASEDPRDGRKRIVYRITAEGRRALRGWHERTPEVYELRDEGMLKLFFADAARPGSASEALRDRAEHSASIAERLREVEKQAERKGSSAYTVLRYGIELNDFIADWCERAARELETETPPSRGRN